MRRTIKLFCPDGDVENLILGVNPYLPPFDFTVDCLDATVTFDEISEDEFLDLLDALDEYVYAEEPLSLEENFVRFAESNGISVATAESCTGGMIASSIVNVSGASNVFFEGMVTYNNLSKVNRLGVSAETLDSFGAVSEETATEMANGLLSENVDFGISTTGIAGPTGGSFEKPVGLVYIGLSYKDLAPVAYRFIFDGDRTTVRTSAKNAALFYAWKYLENIL